MILRVGRRGQPLVALGAVFAVWIGLRVTFWESPLSPLTIEGEDFVLPVRAAIASGGKIGSSGSTSAPLRMAGADAGVLVREASPVVSIPAPAVPFAGRSPAGVRPQPRVQPPGAQPAAGLPAYSAAPLRDEVYALAGMERPPERQSASHWSGDAWLLYRPGSSGALASGAFAGRYGASQAGAVLRYLLASDPHRPAAYLRASSALGRIADRHAALGLAARPLPRLPVSVQAEMRVVQSAARTELAPAVLAVSELAPLALPFDLRAEAYLAGGYVGGANGTPFAGGQVRVDRAVGELAGTALRIGGGAWGGAQRGVRAIDLGPAARAEIPVGTHRLTIEAGYRWRVAGTAEPGSGPALTVSTGF